jgi:hypothetical protein
MIRSKKKKKKKEEKKKEEKKKKEKKADHTSCEPGQGAQGEKKMCDKTGERFASIQSPAMKDLTRTLQLTDQLICQGSLHTPLSCLGGCLCQVPSQCHDPLFWTFW